MKTNKVKKIKKTKIGFSRTIQDTIPIYAIHEKSGIIETSPGEYSRTYLLSDFNYQTATEEEQEHIFGKLMDFLNSFSAGENISWTINNKSIDKEKFKEEHLFKERGDFYDKYRKDYNDFLLSQISEGKNNIIKEKYFTVSIKEKSYKNAVIHLNRLDSQIKIGIQNIASKGATATLLNVEERLNILYKLYNIGTEDNLITKQKINGEEVKSFDFNNLRSMGISVKDIIAPSSMKVTNKELIIGNKYARILQLNRLSSSLTDTFLTEITNTDYNMITNFYIQPVDTNKGVRLVETNLKIIRENVIEQERNLIKNGSSPEMINPNLKFQQDEANKMLNSIQSENQKVFFTNLSICIFANNLEDLDKQTEEIIAIGNKYVCQVGIVKQLQEEGFNSVLPLCVNKLPFRRTLMTSSTAVFLPFSILDICDTNGFAYGKNAVSGNMFIYDRLKGKNFNGFIFGTPGAGKSFIAKLAMLNVILGTDADVIVIDPEAEYGKMCRALKGETIKINPGCPVQINPFDINDAYAGTDEEQLNKAYVEGAITKAKADFIMRLCESVVANKFLGLDPIQKTIIDRCTTSLYTEYFSIPEKKRTKQDLPTLQTFQELLQRQPEPEAREIAIALKLYTTGSLNTFAGHTNVDTDNRFLVYDIKDVGENMKKMSMLVILDSIWNRICSNRKKGKNTWFFVDEIYLLFKDEQSAEFLNELFKRARKYDGVPTGITQNVEDLLLSETARKMLSNCNFVQMLNQAPTDKEQLKALLSLSEAQTDYITNAPAGQGLIYNGNSTIPYVCSFPKDNDLYKILTSNAKEIKAIEDEEKRKAAKEKSIIKKE